MKQAPIVELVGPAGAGKSTLARRLEARDRSVQPTLSVWGLPRPALLASALAVVPAGLKALLGGRPLQGAELAQMVRLGALRRIVARASRRHGVILLDEGPVFGLSWLEVFYGRNGDPGWSGWRRRTIAQWAGLLDVVVLIDAPDSALANRIRNRAKPHMVKELPDEGISDFTAAFRRAFGHVVNDLTRACNGTQSLRVRSLETTATDPEANATQVLGTVGEVLLESAPRRPLVGPVSGRTESDRRAPLTRRASLTAVASLLDYGAKIAVSLVTTPILVGDLGRSLYGVWEMLGRLIGYMTATDGRPTEALRLVISQNQSTSDPAPSRRAIGAAATVWLLMFPVIALVGGALTWFAPTFTHAPAGHEARVRLACGLLVVSFLLSTLASIPESVLRGMNLGYKRMGLQAGLNVLGGALMVGFVNAGFGLPGLSASIIVRAAVTGIVFWALVRHYVPWFGLSRPARTDVRGLFGMSAWLSVGDLINKLNLASDVLILGWVISPAAVTTYALTSYAIRTALGIHVFTAGAAIPGLGGVLGERQYARAANVRKELLVLTWLFVTAVGTTILAWNRSFLSLWVGERFYAGPWVDLLIMLIAVQTAFIRTDAYIIDAALRPRLRVIVGAAAAGVTIGLGLVLTKVFGVIGLCLGVLSGRAVQSIAYPLITRSCLGRTAVAAVPAAGAPRLIALTTAFFAGATAVSQATQAASWPVFVGVVPVTLGVAGLVALWLGPEPETRRVLVARIRAMAPPLGARRRS